MARGKTYNATPSFTYQLNNWLSIGPGVQIQYAKADVGFSLPTGLGNILNIAGNGWGYGLTAGVTVTPTPITTIGLLAIARRSIRKSAAR
jgi:Outer membrane protein transport protein (OMPP1/FadL/TodX).